MRRLIPVKVPLLRLSGDDHLWYIYHVYVLEPCSGLLDLVQHASTNFQQAKAPLPGVGSDGVGGVISGWESLESPSRNARAVLLVTAVISSVRFCWYSML